MARFQYKSLVYTTNTESLDNNKTLILGDGQMQFLDPGSNDRDIMLPAETQSDGLVFFITNITDTTSNLNIYTNDHATLLSQVSPKQTGLFNCNGLNWYTNM